FIFNYVGIFSGFLLIAGIGKLQPQLYRLYPGILTIRGVITGTFVGRMTTGLHVGSIQPTLLKSTREYKRLVSSIFTLSMMGSILFGIAASAFMRANATEFLKIQVLIASTVSLSTFILLPLTTVISVFSYKRGIDPDVVTYPIMSTLADVTSTLAYVLIIISMNVFPLLPVILTGILLMVGLFGLRRSWEREYLRTIKEVLVTIGIVVGIVNVTGALLERIIVELRAVEAVLLLYPMLMALAGDVGSTVGSITTTKLALGEDEDNIMKGILTNWSQYSVIFSALIVTFGGAFISALIMGKGVMEVILPVMGTTLSSSILIIIFSQFVAYASWRRGLNPDNFVIPIESSVADVLTTLFLYAILKFFYL
ncbi:MAG TPA: hypothetical protein ENF41_02780, partial [Candidatus Bathyarchaeota archaeon]|nr:hypothetical protein [Candidatus Bathyarchaeota archaeon]